MTKKRKTTESGQASISPRIKTKLKFTRSETTGALVGFVSQFPKNGRTVGVREDSEYQKKICLVDKDLVGTILTGILYDTEIIPMTPVNGFVPGFIVVKAEPTQFKAKVTIDYRRRKCYRVNVTFGNMRVIYDPFRGNKKSVYDLTECRRFLELRTDIKSLMAVLEEFDAATMVISTKISEDFTERELKRIWKDRQSAE